MGIWGTPREHVFDAPDANVLSLLDLYGSTFFEFTRIGGSIARWASSINSGVIQFVVADLEPRPCPVEKTIELKGAFCMGGNRQGIVNLIMLIDLDVQVRPILVAEVLNDQLAAAELRSQVIALFIEFLRRQTFSGNPALEFAFVHLGHVAEQSQNNDHRNAAHDG